MKIQNTTQSSKRIRLTALDSAMSNIDNSVGAVAKDGKDVLICLSPMVDEIPSNEMYFTTLTGSIEYVGNQGDQIFLSDGTVVDGTLTDDVIFFNVPAGKHKLVLVETRDFDGALLGGEALVEINNFPTLSSICWFSTHPRYPSPNLVKVPTVLPSNLTRLTRMFSRATSFNQDISMWDTSNVTNMENMFELATSFNQDLSQWCVPNIMSRPFAFDQEATAWTLPRPAWGTCPHGGDDNPLPNEIYFTTTDGYIIDYIGAVGDQIISNDSGLSIILDEEGLFNIYMPAGKHKVILNEYRESNYVGLGGKGLVELHNFPALSTVTKFNFCPNTSSPNLVKVPTVLPSNLTDISWMFYEATSFNQPLNSWNVSNVTNMNGMFYDATAFNQDLSGWCVSKIGQEPDDFSNNSPLTTEHKPVWGTCPRGEN